MRLQTSTVAFQVT